MSQSIELPVGELKTALAGLAKVIPTNSFLPVLAGVRFAPDADGAVTVQASDLETSATYRFARATGRNFTPFVLRHDALQRQLKGVGSGVEITLAPGAEGQTRFSYPLGNTRIERPILTQEDKDWPAVPPLRQPGIPLPDGFKAALEQALECASTDANRPVVWGACLDVSQSPGHYLVASDGHHLFSANSFACPLAESVISPSRRIFSWSGLAEDGAWSLAVEPRVKEHPGWLVLRSGHWTIVTKPVEGNFPNWRAALPEPARPKTGLQLSPEAMKWLLKALPQLSGQDAFDKPPVRLSPSKGLSMYTLASRIWLSLLNGWQRLKLWLGSKLGQVPSETVQLGLLITLAVAGVVALTAAFCKCLPLVLVMLLLVVALAGARFLERLVFQPL